MSYAMNSFFRATRKSNIDAEDTSPLTQHVIRRELKTHHDIRTVVGKVDQGVWGDHFPTQNGIVRPL